MLAGSGFKIDANRKESFDIVVFHGYLNEALALAETNPGIELVLLGHDQYSDTMVQQGTTIMGAGRDAEYVVLLEVTREDTAWQIGQEKIYLNSAVPADVEVTSWIREYKIKDKTGSR
jgi:2',3'-cyclic-nucleotide 2'-phosphodiesterase (5'-nucleotidase family)